MHLYGLKKQCPGVESLIVLTDEIKECVLNNRVYKIIPVETTPTQIIQNNQTINNYIANMDTLTKLQHLVQHRNLEILDFETKVENRYKNDARRFQQNMFRGNVDYRENHFMDMISEVTAAKEIENFSILYDKDNDRVHFSTGGGEWETKMKKTGICYIVETIVSYCLEYYEIYLCRKVVSAKSDRPSLLESLESYYRFISTFNIEPYVKGKQDAQILYDENDENYDQGASRGDIEAHRLVDEYMALYMKAKNELSDTQRRATIKEVLEILKSNTKTNIRELNKRIMDIIRIDDDFRNIIIR